MTDILGYLQSFRQQSPVMDGDGALLERFRLQRDERAFATLVQRHGPMVLGMARRILRQSEAAEDVFQATFLVLAQRAGQLASWPCVAGWLVQVTRRTALQARAKAARRTRHEQQVTSMASTDQDDPADLAQKRDLAGYLDSELARLPNVYRSPLVLCHLQGRTKEEAAQQLGWPVGSVSGRLARAKQLLKTRLDRRGLAPALVAGVLSTPRIEATISPLLVQAATLLATAVVHRTSTVPATAAVALAQGVLSSMFYTKLKWSAAALFAFVLGIGGGAWAWPGQNERAATQQQPKIETKPASLLEQLQGVWVTEKAVEPQYDRFSYWQFMGSINRPRVRTHGEIERLHGQIAYDLKVDESQSPTAFSFANVTTGTLAIKDGKLLVSLNQTRRPRQLEKAEDRVSLTLRRATDYDLLTGIWRREQRNPVTGDIQSAEEMIFRGNQYVLRAYSPTTGPASHLQFVLEKPPMKFELHESTKPKGIDLEISEIQPDGKIVGAINYRGITNLQDAPGRDDEFYARRTGIYEITGTQVFRYAVSGLVPFKKVDGQIVVDTGSAKAQRPESFVKAGFVYVFTRVDRSLKDTVSGNTGSPVEFRAMNQPELPKPELPKAATPVDSKRLQELKQERLRLAEERLKLWRESYAAGNATASQEALGTISQQILEAKMSMAKDRAEKIEAMEEHLKRIKQLEQVVEEKYAAGSVTKNEVLAAQLRRVELEIQIEELKKTP